MFRKVIVLMLIAVICLVPSVSLANDAIGYEDFNDLREKTRENKMKTLVRKLYGSKARVIPIDFDMSPSRYDPNIRTKLEAEDLKSSLRALRDSKWRKKLNAANNEKLRVLRSTPKNKRFAEIDIITKKVRKEFMRG